MKRVFIALTISEKTQMKVRKIQENFSSLPVRWLESKNLHITLIPPWNEQNIEDLKEKFRSLNLPFSRLQPFHFHTISFGPNPSFPRLIWVKGKDSEEVSSLKNFLEDALHQKPEQPNFLLHFTLARFRPASFRSFPLKKMDEKIDWEESVPFLVLFESRLTPKGSDYMELAKIPFN